MPQSKLIVSIWYGCLEDSTGNKVGELHSHTCSKCISQAWTIVLEAFFCLRFPKSPKIISVLDNVFNCAVWGDFT